MKSSMHNTNWAAALIVAVSIISLMFGTCLADEPAQPGLQLEHSPPILVSSQAHQPHLSISGGITLSFSAYQGRLPGELQTDDDTIPLQPFPSQTRVGAENRLSLSLNAAITDRISVYARLGGNSLWGVNYPGEAALAPATTSSFLAFEEFSAAYHTDNVWASAGKQTFSFGPLGLMVSNTTTPIDLISGTIVGNGIAASAIVGRLSSEYYLGTDYVIDTDDYIALRAEKELGADTLVAFNYLVSGVGNSSGQSLDLQSKLLGRRFAVEVARFNPGSTITEDSWKDAYAWLTKIYVLDTPTTAAAITYGSADKGFTPAFSSIASSSGATENLLHNSRNLTLDISRYIGAGLSLSGQVSVSQFLDQEFASETLMHEIYPQLSASITASKQISPYSTVSATVTHASNEAVNYCKFGIDLNLYF